MQIKKITTYLEFKTEIVDKDFEEFVKNDGDVRAAFHCAISLFHLHDWVYRAHKAHIDATYTFLKNGKPERVSKASEFANALSDRHADFELIRGVANSAKHLRLDGSNKSRPAPPENTPIDAANTFAQSAGWGEGKYGEMKWGGAPTVMLEGANNNHLVLSKLAASVKKMWDDLFATEKW